MTPYGSTTMGSQTGQQETQTNPGIGGAIFGGLQALGGAFGAGGPFAVGRRVRLDPASDRHLKTDISKVGVHPPTGLPIYGYATKATQNRIPK